MKRTINAITAQKGKRAYKKPTLIKHGNVSKLTLKGGSAFDAMTATNDFHA